MWTVTLHPEEDGIQSKTRESDCSLLVDNPDFPYMPALLELLKLRKIEGKKPLASPKPMKQTQADHKSVTSRIFHLTHREWSVQYAEAVQQLGLKMFGPPVLYQLRHGVASHEVASGRRGLPSLMKRGRWSTLHSVRRYEKGGRLAELLGRLTAPEAAYTQACQANIGWILCGTCPPMLPSMVRSL